MMHVRRKHFVNALIAASCLGLVGSANADRVFAAERGPFGALINVATREAPLRLWVEEHGHGEPILMLHGLGSSTYTWRYIAPALARTHRVIAVDLKGSGRSDKPFDDAYAVLDQVALLQTLIDRKGLTDITLVGHSLGGGIALALSLELNRARPAALKRLVLIDSIAYHQRLPQFFELLKTPLLAEVGIYAVPPELEVYKGLYAAYLDPRKITLEAVRAYALALYDRGGRYALLKMAQEIIPPNLTALIARYRTIDQPTLLIWCAQDTLVPPWVGRRLAHDLPSAHLATLRGCGHVPQEELPAHTLNLIRTFVR
jgi:pimeloyl-ACP methyl ester carboxylesterase